MNFRELKEFLDGKFMEYNDPCFIREDPISIPHRFIFKQDIEISAFWTAILSWGNRRMIINKATELFSLMDNSPYDFIKNHSENDLLRLLSFRHRTFNSTDTLYFIHFLKHIYTKSDSLEDLFVTLRDERSVENSLNRFQKYFISLPETPDRTKKHIPSPERGSACKRLNMFLRWMVRSDNKGVDFGIWKKLNASQLICPCDLHVERVARKLGLVTGKQANWKMALELTENLKKLDPADPVKYDFALFGLGIIEKF
jgi:uncharacterized protein (TIGR02757 family)